MTKDRIQYNTGFTLVELLVSLALFSIVMIAAIGTLYTVNEASNRVTAMRTVLDNLSFATESMTRTIRTGDSFVCGGYENGAVYPADCPFGGVNGPSEEVYLHSTLDNTYIEYRYRIDNTTGNGEIQKCTLQDPTQYGTTTLSFDTDRCVSLTDPSVNVQKAQFYVNGSNPADNLQPSIMIQMQGVANAGPDNIQPFAVQTYVSQRAGN